MNRVYPPDRPLNDAERDRMDAMLSRFRSESAMNNAEEIDGFFAALICSPETAKPSQYLSEIWGGEMADDEAFDDRQELQDFLSLLMRHWNSIVCILEKGEIFGPLLFQDEEGTAHGNDWARGFMRGVSFHHESWKELINDEEHGGPLIPIMILAHEHDPDPEMRPYKDNVDAELREKLILGIAGAVTAIYRYFAPQRRRMAAGLGAEGTANRQAKLKIGRNDPCRCGSGKKYKHCCGKATL
jgi:uncharacterized protein